MNTGPLQDLNTEEGGPSEWCTTTSHRPPPSPPPHNTKGFSNPHILLSVFEDSVFRGGGGGQGGLSLPLPIPFKPGSRPVFFGSRLFAFVRLRNIAQCCVIFPFFSRFPPPLLLPPVHLQPPFLPVSRPPVPPFQ